MTVRRAKGQADQADLFGPAPQPAFKPDPDKVRRRLDSLLAEARAASVVPWSPAILSLYREIFPRMSGYLTADEGAQYCFEFETELARLEAA
jgi:hypothetical protein